MERRAELAPGAASEDGIEEEVHCLDVHHPTGELRHRRVLDEVPVFRNLLPDLGVVERDPAVLVGVPHSTSRRRIGDVARKARRERLDPIRVDDLSKTDDAVSGEVDDVLMRDDVSEVGHGTPPSRAG